MKLKVRNSNLELLRIILIMGVMILHYVGPYGKGIEYAKDSVINYYVLIFLQAISSCAVDAFIIISAYFLCSMDRRSYWKVVELFLQVVLFKVAFYIGSVLLGINEFDTKDFLIFCVPNNYYVILYSVLYLLSPYINILINKLGVLQLKRFMIILLIIFPGWNCIINLAGNILQVEWKGLSTVGSAGSQNGFTIVNFFVLYIIASYIKKADIKITRKRCLAYIAAIVMGIFAWSSIEYNMRWSTVSRNYDNPLVIALATMVFLLFSQMSFSNKVVNELARAAFTCFLFHQPFMSYIGVESVAQGNILILMFHLMVTLISLYFLSYVVYKIYDFIINRLLGKQLKLKNKNV